MITVGLTQVSNLVKISEAASLGLHTMALLARHPHQRLTNHEIADTLGASSHHLAKVMQRLVRPGLLNSVRGPQGGFRLGKPAASIRLLDIYEAVDGPLENGGCLFGEPLCKANDCILGDVVQSVHHQIREYLARTTLEDLAGSVRVVTLDGQHDKPKPQSERPNHQRGL